MLMNFSSASTWTTTQAIQSASGRGPRAIGFRYSLEMRPNDWMFITRMPRIATPRSTSRTITRSGADGDVLAGRIRAME